MDCSAKTEDEAQKRFEYMIHTDNVFTKTEFPVLINPDHLYKSQSGDIFIFGPPKSGTTWLQQILHQIRTKGDESFDDIYSITKYVPNPNQPLPYDINEDQTFHPRIFKCHECYGIIKGGIDTKYIVIVRDPYDAAYSVIKFLYRFYGGDRDLDDEQYAAYLKKNHREGRAENIKFFGSWYPHREDSNVLWLFYEDLKIDLKSTIRRIAHFVGVQLTEEELERINHFGTFEYMEKHKDKFRGDVFVEGVANLTHTSIYTPQCGLVREGKVGLGMDRLSNKSKSVIDELWDECMNVPYGIKSYGDMYNKHSAFKDSNKI